MLTAENEEVLGNDDESLISKFVKDHQPLFAVMGIFGAISIYLTQISTTADTSENEKYLLSFGVATSLFLFGLFSWIILIELWRRKGFSKNLLIDFRNIEYVLFGIPFSMLTLVVLYYIITKLTNQLLAVMSILNYVVGMFIFVYILSKVLNKTNNSFKWAMITLVSITVIIPTLHVIFIRNTIYQRYLFVIIPIMSAMIFGAIISFVVLPLVYIDRKYGLFQWIAEALKRFKNMFHIRKI